jgi:small subunit ribosomal protein S9
MSDTPLKPLIPSLSAVAPAAPAARIERVVRVPKPAKAGWWWGVGRRKTAVARVRLKPHKAGAEEAKVLIQINAKKFKAVAEYFAEERDRADAVAPLKVTGNLGKFDVFVRVAGGGFMGQAGAIKLGIARALRDFDPTVDGALRDNGLLTRDSRDVERKKYGRAGARRSFQFSKR